jgi:hypothetical protein
MSLTLQLVPSLEKSTWIQLCEFSTTHTDCMKDLEVVIHPKLHLHHYVDYLFLFGGGGLIQIIVFSFSSLPEPSDVILHIN